MFLGRKIETSEFEAAAVPHLQDLYRTAVHLVRDRTEAHDLVQNAYLQAWKAFHRFEPGTNCRAWLFKILFNEIRHYRRKWFGNRTVSEGEQSFKGTRNREKHLKAHISSQLQPLPGTLGIFGRVCVFMCV